MFVYVRSWQWQLATFVTFLCSFVTGAGAGAGAGAEPWVTHNTLPTVH